MKTWFLTSFALAFLATPAIAGDASAPLPIYGAQQGAPTVSVTFTAPQIMMLGNALDAAKASIDQLRSNIQDQINTQTKPAQPAAKAP